MDTYAGALNFHRDELISVLEKNPTGHWRGFILQNDYSTRYGYFPSICVKLIDRISSNNSVNCAQTVALGALNSGKMTRFSSAISKPMEKTDRLEELTCNISPVGSIDSSSKISLSNTADSGVGTTSQKSLTYSSPPSTSSRTNTIERFSQPQISISISNKSNMMLQSFSNQKPFSLPLSPLKSPVSSEDVTVIESVYGSSQHQSSSPNSPYHHHQQHYQTVNVTDLLRSGLNESQIIFNWLSDVSLEMYYENFVSSGYDLLTIMKMTPSDLCAIGISDPMHRKLIVNQMKFFNIKDLDDQLNQILNRTKNLKLLLELIHLEQYLSILSSQGYKTISDLYLINCEDLEEIGIRKLGHQKKLMLIIKRLQSTIGEPLNENSNISSTSNNKMTYDLYATVRKPSLTKKLINTELNNLFNQQQHQLNARSMDNLSDDNYLLVKKSQNSYSNSVSSNKPIPPQRTDSIVTPETRLEFNYNNNNNQKVSNYATLPRNRNIFKQTKPVEEQHQQEPLNNNNNGRIEYLLPFANENVGTIKIKDTDAAYINSYTIKQQANNHQLSYRNKAIIPPNCANNNKNYIFNNNNSGVKFGQK